ncbi:MAG TPA: aminopeptidase P family N-terminal domain-containing protein [Xanthobacteraceae bacterium]|nr:aminopeptidase P family N-terminal domain-containing protein [Xanthobacteraceae bacterium]
MRRGLMAWDTEEVPPGILADRLVRLREAMAADGLDALLIYTNFPRPAAVTYLTAFTPYWSDALLYVPKTGEPVFATALSKRVAKWINSVKPVGELVNTPRPGQTVGERIVADASVRTVGILEMDALPAGIYDDLEAAAPAARFVEGGKAFAQARRLIDDSERGLLAKAGVIAANALDQVDPAAMRVTGIAVGAVEKAARLSGAEEAYIHIAPDLAQNAAFARLSGEVPLGARFAMRASVAYKGIWVRRIRSFARDTEDQALCDRADGWLRETALALKPDAPLGPQIVAALGGLEGATLESWLAESSLGSYPLQDIASGSAASASAGDAGTPDKSMLVLTVKLKLGGAFFAGGVTVLVAKNGNVLLTPEPSSARAAVAAA